MLLATQPDVLRMLDTDAIIDGVAEKSELLRKLLLERGNNTLYVYLHCFHYMTYVLTILYISE